MKTRFLTIIFLAIACQTLQASPEGISLFADVLYWNASEQTDGMWASVITSDNNKSSFTPDNIHFDSSVGARGGFGYQAKNNVWDAKLFWTYFPAETDEEIPLADYIILPEFFSGFLSGDFFFGSNLNWQLIMNMVDLEIGHVFNVTPTVQFHPKLGLKGGTINQTINSSWNGVLYTSTEKVTQDYFGIGPTFGIDGRWKIYHGLQIAADLSVAFMWGTWDIKDTYKGPSFLSGPNQKTIKTTLDDKELGTLMVDYFLGLEYVYQKRSDVTFKLGYEMQYWANQLRIPTFQQLPLHGDLTFQGGTCGIYINL